MRQYPWFYILICLFVSVASQSVHAQAPQHPEIKNDDESGPDSTVEKHGWKYGSTINLDFSEESYRNWSLGSENSLTYEASLVGLAETKTALFNYKLTYDFLFGQTNTQSLGLRKTDDLIDISSIFLFKTRSIFQPYFAQSFRTQFATGYDYQSDTVAIAISGFFDPAYLVITAGESWQARKELKTRVGAGVRYIYTNRYNFFADDPTTPEIEHQKFSPGFESVTELDWPIDSIITFKSRLSIFAPVRTLSRMVVDFDNLLIISASSFLKVNAKVHLLNEPDVTPLTQIKQALEIGVSYTIL